MARRHSYTPRRSGSSPRRRDTPRPIPASESQFSLFIPIAIAVVLVAFGVAVSGGSADFPPEAGCTGDACTPLVAAASATPVAASGTSATPAAASGASTTPTAQPAPTTIGSEPPPPIDGYAAAIVEAPCGGRVYGTNEGMPLAPASLTKIMTAIVALERGDPTEMVDITIDGGELSLATDSTAMGLKPGDRLPLLDLVYGLLLRSGHDAALQIAEHVAVDEETFVDLMNEKASELGLVHTHFANSSGLDDPNLYTSAQDIALIGNELLQNKTLAEIVKAPEYQPAWDREKLENKNHFLTNYPNALGIKTGFTEEAAQTIVAAAIKNGRTLITSVLHSEDMYVDAALLLDWAFANTESVC